MPQLARHTMYHTHIVYRALSLNPFLFFSFGRNLQIASSERNPSSVTALKGHFLNSLCLSTRNRILPNLKTSQSWSGMICTKHYTVEPLYYEHFGTLILVLITEVSSIRRLLNTVQYYTGTQNGVLIVEVSVIWRFVIERFHCITFRKETIEWILLNSDINNMYPDCSLVDLWVVN